MDDITSKIHGKLIAGGADLVAFGDISELPDEIRRGMRIGIIIAIKYPKDVILGIHDHPTPEYLAHYNSINGQLDALVTMCERELTKLGYSAFAQTRAAVGKWEGDLATQLPHKTIATRAGLGWIGKSALLVTEEYGSAIRISSVLTDAPLRTNKPIDESRCGQCTVCTFACPARAVKGKKWAKGMQREDIFDAWACHNEANERSIKHLGEKATICGKCIEACPYTRAYIAN